MPTRSLIFLTMAFLLVCCAGGIRVQVSNLFSGFAEPGIVPKEWVRAGDLVPGDHLLGEDGQEVAVESIRQTEDYEKVYNLRVADNHTYFVGGDGWGFDVWVHNARCSNIVLRDGKVFVEIRNKFDVSSEDSRQLRLFVRIWNKYIVKEGGILTRRALSPEENAASKAWRAFMRAKDKNRFTDKVVGHVPDAAAGGLAVPVGDKAMALSPSVNSYIGGIISHIKVGTIYRSYSCSLATKVDL